ncbi:MAG: AraC family transcriptional regulator [Bacillota bacterium]|nr:AraC family transcriptional regulator [Bacillota bacterium]
MDWKECVQKMIDYIENNLKEDLTLSEVSMNIGYSQFYCSKAFHAQAGICMKDYIRMRRISSAALQIRDTQKRILDIALEYGYNSQEAFTRSFIDVFDITPAAYRRLQKPIPLFIRRYVNTDHQHNKIGDDFTMQEKYMKDVKVTFITKPARRMLVWYKNGATNYHELCDTEGAHEIWGLMESIKGTLGGVIAAWLNENGRTRYVWGVEMPADYKGPIPDGFECIDTPECQYVKFCHPPYEESEHEEVTEAVWNKSELWNPKDFNMEWNDASNPVYEDDRADEGYLVLKPVKKI